MTPSERRAHVRHEARACVDPALLPVFDRVVPRLWPSTRMTLAEAFAEWCRAYDRAQRREARERALERFVTDVEDDDGDPMDREVDPANFVCDLWLFEDAA